MKAKFTASLALAIIFTLTACGEHSWEDWLGLDNSSSSKEEASVVSSSSSGGSGDYTPGVVGPLLQTRWNQFAPYSNMIPSGAATWQFKTDDHNRTGCHVTAAAQMMKYYNHPKRGSGQSEPYTTPTGVFLPSVNFNVAYDYDNMLNEYTRNNPGTEQQQNAVALLMYHVGISEKMLGSTREVMAQLTTFFGYDKSMQLHDRKYFTDAEWEAIIRQQLDLRLLVLYSGGHAWIVDGYDNTGKFHMNWGWGGKHEGWYSLNNLTPGPHNYNHNPDTNDPNYNHNIIYTNIMPDKGSTGSNEWALNSFAANKITVSQNEPLTVSFRPSSAGFFIGGQYGAALVDNNGNIKAVIGTKSASARNPGTGWSLSSNPIEINGFVPETVAPGRYNLRIVTKPENGDWKIVARSDISENVPNVIPITVTAGEPMGGYGMALTAFSTTKTSVSQNETFTISIAFRNMSSEVFPGGQLGAVLVDNSGEIIAVIGTQNFRERDPGAASGVGTPSCKVPTSVPIGQYKLRIAVKPTGKEEWQVATMANDGVPTSINFEVK